METLTHVCPAKLNVLKGCGDAPKATRKLVVFTPEQRVAGQIARQTKISEWEKLDLRQEWVDERFMRSIISAAKINAPTSIEPATPERLRKILKRTGLLHVDIVEAVGVGPKEFLEKNPRLPLWAAVSIVLESTGKYDKKATQLTEEQGGH